MRRAESTALNPRSGSYRRRRSRGFVNVLLLAAIVASLVYSAWHLVPLAFGESGVELRVIGLGDPLEGATVRGAAATVSTNSSGIVHLDFEAPTTLTVSAPGYVEAVFDVTLIPDDGPLWLQMDPVVLTGRVVAPDGSGVVGVTVTLGDQQVVSRDQGDFELVAAVPGTVTAARHAWEPSSAEWNGTVGMIELTMEPFVVRGLRVDGFAAGDQARFQEILRMADESAVNTLIFDAKDEKGYVQYLSEVPEAGAVGAITERYEPREVLQLAEARDLYTIMRIVTFQDPLRAPARPNLAIADSETGEVWRTAAGLGWMDPTDRGSWDYPLDLAAEACEMGFDEIQFDYVRFPTDGDTDTAAYDGPVDEESRVATIAAFLQEARSRLQPLDCAVSADIFAIVLHTPDDQELGQDPETLSWAVDAVSPMAYPSHFDAGWDGLEDPSSNPSRVVGGSLDAGMPKVVGGAVLRPWLQGFSFTADQVSASIREAENRGLGWMLWHADSEYMPESLPDE